MQWDLRQVDMEVRLFICNGSAKVVNSKNIHKMNSLKYLESSLHVIDSFSCSQAYFSKEPEPLLYGQLISNF